MSFLDERFADNTVLEYLIAVGILVAAIVAAKVIKWLSTSTLKRLAEKTATKLDDILLELVDWPLYWLVFVLGAYTATRALVLPVWLGSILYALTILAASIVVAMTAARFIDILFETYIEKIAAKTDSRLDDQIMPVLRRTLKGVLWLMTVLLVLDNFGYDVTALITGLGLGGLALAMAAKDTLTNVLGGFTIFIDQPFRIGDVVTMMGTTGTVEEVGLRTTRIRTFEGHLVTIPNAAAATSIIENISERPKIRTRFSMGLTYDTPIEKCREAVALVVAAIKTHASVVDEPNVYFVDFGDSSLGFQVTYFIDKTADLFEAKHAINLAIKESLAAANISMAFPTVTVDAPPQLLRGLMAA